MSKCNLNTCSTYYYSACVKYTGQLIEGSYITLPDCHATINDMFNQIDIIIKELKDNDGIAKQLLKDNNCDLDHLTQLIADTEGTKVKTSDTIIALLKTICDLESEITVLQNIDIYEKTLPVEIQNLLILKLGCFDGIDPCNPTTITLKELLMKLIYKLCP
jgi:hypothetical protein